MLALPSFNPIANATTTTICIIIITTTVVVVDDRFAYLLLASRIARIAFFVFFLVGIGKRYAFRASYDRYAIDSKKIYQLGRNGEHTNAIQPPSRAFVTTAPKFFFIRHAEGDASGVIRRI